MDSIRLDILAAGTRNPVDGLHLSPFAYGFESALVMLDIYTNIIQREIDIWQIFKYPSVVVWHTTNCSRDLNPSLPEQALA